MKEASKRRSVFPTTQQWTAFPSPRADNVFYFRPIIITLVGQGLLLPLVVRWLGARGRGALKS
jgi:hypothetical protein